MPWGQLTLIGGPDASDDIPSLFFLDETTCSVGRAEENGLKINRAYISGKHFTIRRIIDTHPFTYEVCDHSTNGTFLNNELIGKHRTTAMKSDDKISFLFSGNEKIAFKFTLIDSNEESIEPPTKIQRSSQNKRPHSSLSNNNTGSNSNSGSVDDVATLNNRITSLERVNKQLENRIANNITKLESSAREITNLGSLYQNVTEQLQVKENELNEAKQMRFVVLSLSLLALFLVLLVVDE